MEWGNSIEGGFIFEKPDHVQPFLQYPNNRHDNIKFTVEEEADNKLPFLDVLICKTDDIQLSTITYRKPTYTGLLASFTSFTAYTFKIGLIRTLADRAFKIKT